MTLPLELVVFMQSYGVPILYLEADEWKHKFSVSNMNNYVFITLYDDALEVFAIGGYKITGQ
jgi:hypothetical protein